MKKLFEKNGLLFAIIWIVVYVVGMSGADQLSAALGCEKCVTLPFAALLCLSLLGWIVRSRLTRLFGLCRPSVKASRCLFYLPLLLLASCNLWRGVHPNRTVLEGLFYIGSMLCVGFLEEIIFRGLLFRAMEKNGLRSAIIVSSLTFGIGHIVNLINGSGADLLSNLCQVVSAIAFGFLFVILFHRGGSLLPCILTHSLLNALSFFAVPRTPAEQIIISLILTITAGGYAWLLTRTLPEPAAPRS